MKVKPRSRQSLIEGTMQNSDSTGAAIWRKWCMFIGVALQNGGGTGALLVIGRNEIILE